MPYIKGVAMVTIKCFESKKTLRNSGESGDRELKCRRDHRGGLLQIRGTFGGRPPSRFRVTASFRLFQSGFYRLGSASKTMEGIVRRAPKA